MHTDVGDGTRRVDPDHGGPPTRAAQSLRTVLDHPDLKLVIEPLGDGRRRLTVEPKSSLTVRRRQWITRYPMELIHQIFAVKGLYTCDEIMREEDPSYVERSLRNQLLEYVHPSAFAGTRVLDFGCGSGASTIVLTRLLPPCELIGVELSERLLTIARSRALHLGLPNVQFLRSPAADRLPEKLGEFEYIVFSAVFEHLLPAERPALLGLIWRHLRPGGVLFLNQTPHRYSPVEIHTTGGLPLINYLPDWLAHRAARRFSRFVRPDDDWQTLLANGIRGGTVSEILSILRRHTPATLLAPRQGDRIDLWLRGLSRRYAVLKRCIWIALRTAKALTRIEFTPSLDLAIRKGR